MVLAAIAAAFLAGAPALAAPASKAEREALKKALLSVVQKGPMKSARLGIHLQSLDDGTTVFSQNAEDLLNPASNVKLVTAATALTRLGPDYRYETEFHVDPVSGGKTAALYVRGKGDPTITTERLYGIVSELLHTGLREVGEVVIDDSWFDAERLAAGYDQEDSDRSYMAPTGAVSLNWNTVGIYLRPSESPGRKGAVEIEPPSDHFIVRNELTTARKGGRRFSVSSEVAGEKQLIWVKGSAAPEREALAVWKKIDQPSLYFGHTLKQMLQDRGVKVKGKVKPGAVGPKARLLHIAQSDTLDIVLKRLNKNSSNFVAEQLIKTLGAEVKGAPGSFAKGISVVEDFLQQEVGIARGAYVMKNGSGLNDTNRFSAAQFTRLLAYMWQRFPLAPEYLSSLGIAGKDGTLKYRFEGSEAEGRLRAKTGTLEHVSALSGFVQSASGEKLAFSVMANDFPGRASPVIQGIDALGTAVAASGTAQDPAGAVAKVLSTDAVLATDDELKTRLGTYLALAKKADRRNVPFLRTAWRNEKDPAVKAVVADAVYSSNPTDGAGARALLDSFAASAEVYGRLRRISRQLGIEVPGMSAMVGLAAEGNPEAVSRVVELARSSGGDGTAEQVLSRALAEVALTAPEELVSGLKQAPAEERDAATGLLARGLMSWADSQHPFWSALRSAMGSTNPEVAQFARQLDGNLSLKIAQEKAAAKPKAPVETKPGG